MSAQLETWRVNTPEGIFETDLETLKQWIAEGCVLPTDKVSKGNLNWIDAGRAPMLRSAFAADASSVSTPAASTPAVSTVSMPAVSTLVQPASATAADHSSSFATNVALHNEPAQNPPALLTDSAGFTHSVVAAPPSNICYSHPQVASKYVCKTCSHAFCNDCTRFLGMSKIPVCPLCGDLCRPAEKMRQQAARCELQQSGFGFADFGRALAYPLQHKMALFCGAALYGFLLMGGWRGRIVASVILFGCISHVISQVAWGRMDRNFMPDFSAFSMWDDVAVPFALGVSITIVSWGPTIVLLLALVFGIFSAGAPAPSLLAQAPPEQHEVQPPDLAPLFDSDADPKKVAEANKKLDQLRPGYQIGQEAEKSKRQLNDPAADVRMLMSFLGASIVFVLLLLLSIGWAIFYYPMALAVAGYTQSFGSVINPLVGLDTIRRMGLTYFKAFGMVLIVQVVGFVVAVIVAIITAPFALPFFGNLPALFIDGSLTFYFNLVIACILGLSLFKCADRLGIAVD
jgi:hypothetical protein